MTSTIEFMRKGQCIRQVPENFELGSGMAVGVAERRHVVASYKTKVTREIISSNFPFFLHYPKDQLINIYILFLCNHYDEEYTQNAQPQAE